MATTRVGILSDTHGTLPSAAIERLSSVNHIIHAGDVGGMHVLLELEALSPVTAVEGNMDHHDAATLCLRRRESLLLDGIRFLIVHDLGDLRAVAAPDDVRVVVSGHTHIATVEYRGDVLFINPGSPVRPRRNGPSVALVELDNGCIEGHIVPL